MVFSRRIAGRLFAALAASSLWIASAQTAPGEAIGVVSASGHFTLEGAEIWGNSTLFDGARIETSGASSQLSLSNGVKVQLAAGSIAEVHRNRLVLEQGIGQVTAPSGAQSDYEVGIAGFNVLSDGGRFQVGLNDGAELLVASLDGTARVRQGAGSFLASISAGQKRSFALLQDITRTGCLLVKDGGFILQVDDSPEVLQLNGPDLAANVGNRVEAQGTQSGATATIAPATSVVIVTAVAPQSQGGCLTAAAALNAQASMPQVVTAGQTPAAQPTAPAPGTAPSPAQVSTGGMSTGAKVAIVGLIVGGGAGGAAFALSNSKKSTSP